MSLKRYINIRRDFSSKADIFQGSYLLADNLLVIVWYNILKYLEVIAS